MHHRKIYRHQLYGLIPSSFPTVMWCQFIQTTFQAFHLNGTTHYFYGHFQVHKLSVITRGYPTARLDMFRDWSLRPGILRVKHSCHAKPCGLAKSPTFARRCRHPSDGEDMPRYRPGFAKKKDEAYEPECSHACWWHRCPNTFCEAKVPVSIYSVENQL